MSATAKQHTSFRMTIAGLDGLRTLAAHFHASQVAVLETLIRNELIALGFSPGDTKPAEHTKAFHFASPYPQLNRLHAHYDGR